MGRPKRIAPGLERSAFVTFSALARAPSERHGTRDRSRRRQRGEERKQPYRGPRPALRRSVGVSWARPHWCEKLLRGPGERKREPAHVRRLLRMSYARHPGPRLARRRRLRGCCAGMHLRHRRAAPRARTAGTRLVLALEAALAVVDIVTPATSSSPSAYLIAPLATRAVRGAARRRGRRRAVGRARARQRRLERLPLQRRSPPALRDVGLATVLAVLSARRARARSSARADRGRPPRRRLRARAPRRHARRARRGRDRPRRARQDDLRQRRRGAAARRRLDRRGARGASPATSPRASR